MAVTDGKTDNAAEDVEGGQKTVEILLTHGSSNEESSVDESKVSGVGQETSRVIVLGESMSRAVHDANELRNRKEEVEELRNEEQHESLREVALDGGNSERHSSKVSEGITDESLRRVGIVVRQSQNTAKEGKHEVQAVHVLLGARTAQLDKVVNEHRESDDDSLTSLQSCIFEGY